MEYVIKKYLNFNLSDRKELYSIIIGNEEILLKNLSKFNIHYDHYEISTIVEKNEDIYEFDVSLDKFYSLLLEIEKHDREIELLQNQKKILESHQDLFDFMIGKKSFEENNNL